MPLEVAAAAVTSPARPPPATSTRSGASAVTSRGDTGGDRYLRGRAAGRRETCAGGGGETSSVGGRDRSRSVVATAATRRLRPAGRAPSRRVVALPPSFRAVSAVRVGARGGDPATDQALASAPAASIPFTSRASAAASSARAKTFATRSGVSATRFGAAGCTRKRVAEAREGEREAVAATRSVA